MLIKNLHMSEKALKICLLVFIIAFIFHLTNRTFSASLNFSYEHNFRRSSDNEIFLMLDWSPDSQYLATLSIENDSDVVSIRDTKTQEITAFLFSSLRIYRIDWNPLDNKILIATENGVEVWDLSLTQLLAEIELYNPSSVSWSPDGNRVAIAYGDFFSDNGRRFMIWDINTDEIIKTFNEFVFKLKWSPDGQYILTTYTGAYAALWSATTYKRITLLKSDYFLYGGEGDDLANWSNDSQKVAIVGNDNTSAKYVVQIWDLTSEEPITTLVGPEKFLTTVKWSPDGNYIVGAGVDNVAMIWDATNFNQVATFQGGNTHIAIEWSPDGRYFAASNQDNDIVVWDIIQRQPVQTFRRHTQVIYTLAWNPESNKLASGGLDGDLIIWDID